MTIDTSGQWWVGDRPADIEAYLQAYTEDGYRSDRFKLSRCECGSERFALAADDDEGCARATCKACDAERYLLDSASYWDDANPEAWVCVECRSDACNVGVGLALMRGDATAVRWAYVGCRCANCGVLGCFAGWKLDGDPLSDSLNRI